MQFILILWSFNNIESSKFGGSYLVKQNCFPSIDMIYIRQFINSFFDNFF